MRKTNSLFPLIFILLACGQAKKEPKEKETITKTLEVKVSAYNSVPSQTTATNSNIAAWGDTLVPGMKSIAISRDLPALGIDYKKEVKISGLPGTYIVLDKMNKRHRKRIDIYMGTDVKAATEWGIKKRLISWEMPRDSINPDSLEIKQ